MAMTCLTQCPVCPGNWCTSLTACSQVTRAPRCPRSNSRTARSRQSSRISKHDYTLPRRTRQREGNLEELHAAAEAELEDARTAADARALESQLKHECSTLEEVHKRTTELEGRLAFLKLEVESSSMRGRNTAIRLEERVQALIADD